MDRRLGLIGRWVGLALVLAGAEGTAAAATSWADHPDAAADPAYFESRKFCAAVRHLPPPVLAPGETAAPKDCVSETLYYGIGVPADPAAARRCALRERSADPDGEAAFAGTAMLVTLYANGQGAPRDLSMATSLACLLPGAPEEMDGRVKHLAALGKDGPGPVPFGFCDDVTSGVNQGACAAHDSAVAAVARTAALDALAGALPAADRTAFAAARRAAEVFAKARGANEVDLSGTARAAFAIEAEDAARDDFLALQQRLAAAKLPAATAATAAADDKALNAAYQAVMRLDDPQWGTPTKDGIKATQRAWLAYRNAVAAFAAGRFGPPAAACAVSAMTARRTKELEGFLS